MFRKYLNSCKGISYDLMEETFAFSIFWSIGVFGSLLLRNIGHHINTQEGGANHQYMKGTGTCVAYLTRSYSRIPTKPFVLWIHSQLKFCNAKVSFIPANMMESDLIQIDIRLFLDTTFLPNLIQRTLNIVLLGSNANPFQFYDMVNLIVPQYRGGPLLKIFLDFTPFSTNVTLLQMLSK